MPHASTGSTDAFDAANPFDEAVAKIPSCALDEDGKREQRARYALLAGSVTRVEREPQTASIYFDRDLDRQTLEQALSVERECCPFFTFGFDVQSRALRATVPDIAHAPALDALGHALEAARRPDPEGQVRAGG